MSRTHICTKCKNSVFTLAPRNNSYGIDTGVNVLTCLECGSQDAPEQVEVDTSGVVQRAAPSLKKQAQVGMNPEQLRAYWLEQFNKYANEKKVNYGTYISQFEQQRLDRERLRQHDADMLRAERYAKYGNDY